MRPLIFISLCGVALSWAAVPAQADVQSYCEAYARDQADERLSGGAILGAKPKLTAAEWKERQKLAMADCLTLYTPQPRIEPVTATPERLTEEPEPVPAKRITIVPLKQKPTVTPKPKQKAATPAQKKKSTDDPAALIAGSPAWKNYCAAKHPSYNRETNTYTSLSGKQRPCRLTTTPVPTRATTRAVSTKAIKSAEPVASGEDPWKSFDYPDLPLNR